GEVPASAGGGRHLYERDGGYMDPVAAAEDLAQAATERGVRIQWGQQVIEVIQRGGCVTGLKTAAGDEFSSPLIVNAAGPWCGQLSSAAGLSLPWDLVPTRIQVLYLDRGPSLPGHIPVTADMAGGIYFRTQNAGQQLVVGSVREEDEREAVPDPDHFQTTHDDEFGYVQLHMLAHRLPGLPTHGRVRGYCGLYTVNRDDVHPVLGPTELDGFWVANGFSGHGFKIAPAVGALLADAIAGRLIDDPFSTSVPLETFGVSREPITLQSRSVLA
ncbi:MAG: FAD-binding oxidoreductase, partial [Pseudomonadota bacterium]